MIPIEISMDQPGENRTAFEHVSQIWGRQSRFKGIARRTLGTCLLLIVVMLWTASNFLASTIFADNTYSKPFFLTYVNTSAFILPLLPIIVKRLYRVWRAGGLANVTSFQSLLSSLDSHDLREHGSLYMTRVEDGDANEYRDGEDDQQPPLPARESSLLSSTEASGKLGLRATAKLSFKFCMLWFLANYFVMACLQYTTVGSATILTSTSGVWTLVFGAALGVERFTFRKLLGVIASLVGIILISRLDISKRDNPLADADSSQGSFPYKTPGEIALGDAMAAFSAILYGLYTIVMKKQVGDESRVNMPLFFGLVGLFNVFLLWPGFLILHFTNIEPFSLPDSSWVWMIILVNSATSLISDICWAYAMLLTSPLAVTLGLSLTIPLSLIGEIILRAQYASAIYWVGAIIVFLSFMLVNYEGNGSTVADMRNGDPSDVYEALAQEE